MEWIKNNYLGIIISLIISIVAYLLGNQFPIVGGAVFGILIGIIINNVFGKSAKSEAGLNFTSKKILQWSIILLGSGLNLTQIYKTGLSSLIIIFTTITAALLTTYAIGRFLKIDFNLKSLIGVGTAICGGSAIAAIAPIVEAEEKDIAYSISTVFIFNIIAVFTFPAIGHLLEMSQMGFGLFAGTAINDTSSVVAAGYIYGNSAGDYATIVKLTRTLMIIPIAVLFVFIKKIRKTSIEKTKGNFNILKIFPWFIIGFIVMAAINTSGIIDAKILNIVKETGKFMIIMALSAIGLKTDLKNLLKTGIKPAILGLAVWASVVVTSIVFQRIGGQW